MEETKMNYEDYIGENIREVRLSKGLSQQAVAEKCGFSNTMLSQYENGKKTPGLFTTAKIAKALGVSIDRLYYGDENKAFISTSPDEGRKIVNCFYALWEMGIIDYYENFVYNDYSSFDDKNKKRKQGIYLNILKYPDSIKRLIESLNGFKARKETYQTPEQYLEMILDSVAVEINHLIERDKQEEEIRKKNKR